MMMMEWLADPTIWFGLFTLVLLEIVLGIDNLIFIAILADKLPPEQRDKARIIGLSLALFMRIALLFSISWLVGLTEPWIEIFGRSFSGRDSILLAGGVFLLFKATMELHERLEGPHHRAESGKPRVHASFWSIIAQIVALDAVFSIDSVITAVGMANELSVMVIAVVVAVLIMMVASKPLTRFVNQHPTLIVLCLGFLLMIGCSLVAEGFSFHIPKGYLYAAIGFSVAVEMFNQLTRAKKKKAIAGTKSLRSRTAEAVQRLLGGKVDLDSEDLAVLANTKSEHAFNAEERNMISGVLSLAELNASFIMTPRTDLDAIHVDDDTNTIKQKLVASPFSRVVVLQDSANEAIGFIQKKDVLMALIKGEGISISALLQEPLIVHDSRSVLDILGSIKKTGIPMGFVVNELGEFEGIVTLTDVMGAIAGEIPEEYETHESPYIIEQDDGSYQVDGRTNILELQRALSINLPQNTDFSTVAGLVLDTLRSFPEEGQSVILNGWKLTVVSVQNTRIAQVLFRPIEEEA